MADHLSRLTIAHNTYSPPINDEFPEESLLVAQSSAKKRQQRKEASKGKKEKKNVCWV